MKFILLLILLTSSVLNAQYLRTIRIATFNTQIDAQEALHDLNVFASEQKNIIALQKEWGFEFKARRSGKYYITLVEPFTQRKVLQEVIDTLRISYTDVYVTSLKTKIPSLPSVKKTPEIIIEQVITKVVPEVISEVTELKINQDEIIVEPEVVIIQEEVTIPKQVSEIEEDTISNEISKQIQELKISKILEETNYVNTYLWQGISLILLLLLMSLIRYVIKYKKENETYFNTKLISDEKYEQLSLEIKDREKYLSHASHELRAPMTAIMGLTHLVLDSKMGKQEKEYIKQIENSATNLLNIVNDILDVSKIRAGELHIEKAEFNINDTLEYVSNIISLQAKKNNVNCLIDTDKSLPSHFIGDSLRLGQVLINLLGNAVKFTKDGDVSLSLKQLSNNGDNINVEFSIRDTGIGMTREQLGTIFHSFSQANESTSRKFGGTGLGLSISQELVRMMKGEIKVKSELHKGTTFTFAISFKLKDHLNKRYYRLPSTRFLNKRVLVVDSSQRNTMLLIRMLGYFKYRTHTIPSFEEAVLDDDLKFDLVIISKEQVTLSTLDKLRKMREKHNFKLVLLSELFSSLHNEILNDIEIDAYLKTPFNQQNILHMIIELFATKREESKEPSHKSKDILDNVIDKHILVAEDNKVNHKVISGLLQDAPIEVTYANNGREAIDTLLSGKKIDLILMDLSMPVLNGLDATQEIRQHERFDAIPILAFTADVMEDTISQAMTAGMQGYISKPIIIDIFYKKIYDALQAPKKEDQRKSLQNLEQEMIDSEYNELSVSVGLKHYNQDKEFYNSSLKEFKTMYINSSLDLEELCKLGKFKDARHKAMDIKDVSLSIGAYNLCESAATMEYSLEKGPRSNWVNLIAFYETELAKLFKDIDRYLKKDHS